MQLPGEPFADIVLRLRDYSSIENTLSISTANGSIGYIVTREAYVAVGEDVADAVWYFAACARNTTGAELTVDGGNTIQLYPIIKND